MLIILNTVNNVVIKDTRYHKKKTIQVTTKKAFESENLMPEQMLDKKGKVIKGYCLVRFEADYFKIKHSFEDVIKMVRPIEIKGYKSYG